MRQLHGSWWRHVWYTVWYNWFAGDYAGPDRKYCRWCGRYHGDR